MQAIFAQLVSRFNAYTVSILAIAAAVVGGGFKVDLSVCARWTLFGFGWLAFLAACVATSLKAVDNDYADGVAAFANVLAIGLLFAISFGALAERASAGDDSNRVVESLAAYVETARTPNATLDQATFDVSAACARASAITNDAKRAMVTRACAKLVDSPINTQTAFDLLRMLSGVPAVSTPVP